MPKVSVVIPAYNAMAFLPETVDSVLQQTFTDFEVLIVDDGSTDNTASWVSAVADSRVHLISQKNQGVSAARNTGIKHAQGEFVAFLDADDLWQPTKLEKQVSRLDNNSEVGLVYTWTLLIDEDGKPINIKYTFTDEGNVWQKILVGDIVCSGSSAMVRRCCFEVSGMFDPDLSPAADFDMWTRIAKHYQFSVIKEFLLLYRRSSSGMSRNHLKMIKDLDLTFAKRFQSVPADLSHLKDVAYGGMYRYLAWESMYEGDSKAANRYCQQALSYCPDIRYTKLYYQLRFAIFLTRWFGSESYSKLLALKSRLQIYKAKTISEP